MIRIGAAVVIIFVAEKAFGRSTGILSSDMAFATGSHYVNPGQYIPRLIMVERRRSPPLGSMTRLAFRRELRRDMVGIRG